MLAPAKAGLRNRAPLLSPHAGECVRLAIDAGLNVHLNTNCTTLGDRNIRIGRRPQSLNALPCKRRFPGYDKESHESIYVGSRFEDTLFSATMNAAGWHGKVTIRKDGFRSNGSEPPPLPADVLVVGDSFTFGDKVSDNGGSLG